MPGPVFASAGIKLAQFEDPDIRISFVAGSKLLNRRLQAEGRRQKAEGTSFRQELEQVCPDLPDSRTLQPFSQQARVLSL